MFARSEGKDGDGEKPDCRLTRSGETAKSGVPGEAGKQNLGSMQLNQ